MWEQFTPADIERVRHLLAAERADIMSRHEEDLNRLDIDQTEVEQFARVVAAFAKKHLASATENAGAAVESSMHPTDSIPQAQVLAPRLEQELSRNFGGPLRKTVR
jgi:hypothetical protein